MCGVWALIFTRNTLLTNIYIYEAIVYVQKKTITLIIIIIIMIIITIIIIIGYK